MTIALIIVVWVLLNILFVSMLWISAENRQKLKRNTCKIYDFESYKERRVSNEKSSSH